MSEWADLFHGQLCSQVTARNHCAVNSIQNVLQIAHTVCALYLRQHSNGRTCSEEWAGHCEALLQGYDMGCHCLPNVTANI